MKNFSFVVLIAMALTMVACGNKNSSGGSANSSVDMNSLAAQTVVGYVDHANPSAFLVGTNSYRIVDQYSIMKNAYANSGVTYMVRYKVTLTGVFTSNQVNTMQYPQNQGQQAMTVIPSAATFAAP